MCGNSYKYSMRAIYNSIASTRSSLKYIIYNILVYSMKHDIAQMAKGAARTCGRAFDLCVLCKRTSMKYTLYGRHPIPSTTTRNTPYTSYDRAHTVTRATYVYYTYKSTCRKTERGPPILYRLYKLYVWAGSEEYMEKGNKCRHSRPATAEKKTKYSEAIAGNTFFSSYFTMALEEEIDNIMVLFYSHKITPNWESENEKEAAYAKHNRSVVVWIQI